MDEWESGRGAVLSLLVGMVFPAYSPCMTLLSHYAALVHGLGKLMVVPYAPPPATLAAGVVAGVLWWRLSARAYERADREIAARKEAAAPKAQAREVLAARGP